MKSIEDYTLDELSAKIDNIKAERERTANALKRYEEELEQRTCNIPLGVPVYASDKNVYILDIGGTVINGKINPGSRTAKLLSTFETKKSAEKHAEMLLTWRKALVANSKGEPIDIKALLPLLRKGWVAMNKSGSWRWYESKPKQGFIEWMSTEPTAHLYLLFNLKPAENWETSLMECGI